MVLEHLRLTSEGSILILKKYLRNGYSFDETEKPKLFACLVNKLSVYFYYEFREHNFCCKRSNAARTHKKIEGK